MDSLVELCSQVILDNKILFKNLPLPAKEHVFMQMVKSKLASNETIENLIHRNGKVYIHTVTRLEIGSRRIPKTRLMSKLYKNGKLQRTIVWRNEIKSVFSRYVGFVVSYYEYNDDIRHGFSSFNCAVKSETGYYWNGLKDGLWTECIRRGQAFTKKLVYHYVRDKKHGQFMKYNGQEIIIELGQYRDNKREGIWQYYDHEGNLERKILYRDGQEIRPSFFERLLAKLY